MFADTAIHISDARAKVPAEIDGSWIIKKNHSEPHQPFIAAYKQTWKIIRFTLKFKRNRTDNNLTLM